SESAVSQVSKPAGCRTPRDVPCGRDGQPTGTSAIQQTRRSALRHGARTLNWYGRSVSLAHFLILVLFSPSLMSAEEEPRSALKAQRKTLVEAVKGRDAAGVAKIFTSDAKLMMPGLETLAGRESIQKFWQAGLSRGSVKGIAFAPVDITGESDGLLVETGTLTTLDDEGKEKDRSRYLLVWKREESEWRIHRDMANSELAPGPKVDRVGFPKDYRTFEVLGVPVRTNTGSSLVMTAYGNDLAFSI